MKIFDLFRRKKKQQPFRQQEPDNDFHVFAQKMIQEKLEMSGDVDVNSIIINDYSVPEKELPETEVEGKLTAKNTELIRKSNIVKVLKEGLDAANASNRFPKNAKKICEDAMDEMIEEMSVREMKHFTHFILTTGYAKFALLWQKYQTKIQNNI